MIRVSGIIPTNEQIAELAQSDVGGEIVMLNLLKFSDMSQEYERYEQLVRQQLAAVGAEVRWVGLVQHLFIGDAVLDDWDAVALVAYPSREAFMKMVTSQGYQEAAEYRVRGLASTVLLCCVGMD
ncbi:DUF1330 domain-containing protein [Streptomyces sp. NPDC055085]